MASLLRSFPALSDGGDPSSISPAQATTVLQARAVRLRDQLAPLMMDGSLQCSVWTLLCKFLYFSEHHGRRLQPGLALTMRLFLPIALATAALLAALCLTPLSGVVPMLDLPASMARVVSSPSQHWGLLLAVALVVATLLSLSLGLYQHSYMNRVFVSLFRSVGFGTATQIIVLGTYQGHVLFFTRGVDPYTRQPSPWTTYQLSPQQSDIRLPFKGGPERRTAPSAPRTPRRFSQVRCRGSAGPRC